MRNAKLKDVRAAWKTSRFFFGKNRVMQLGLKFVSDETDEDPKLEQDMEKLREQMVGQCGLLFTCESKETVLEWFESYSATEFARSGFRATKTVLLKEGKFWNVPWCGFGGIYIFFSSLIRSTGGILPRNRTASSLPGNADKARQRNCCTVQRFHRL